MSVEYNTPPSGPAYVQTSEPLTGCVAGNDRPVIASAADGPRLHAVLSDADTSDALQGEFQYWHTNGELVGTYASPPQVSGADHSYLLPSLQPGAWSWRVRSWDGRANSFWSDWCEFTVTDAAPTTAPSVSSAQYPEATYVEPTSPNTFMFGSNGSTGVTSFSYSFGSQQTGVVNAASGSASVSWQTPVPGRTALTVTARNAAGNAGPTRTYYLLVNSPGEDPAAHWPLDETAGRTRAADSVRNVGATLLGGPTFTGTGGRTQTTADGSLTLDNLDDAAQVQGPMINTARDFSVAAWVRLPELTTTSGPADDRAVLSQEGSTRSGLWLGYDADALADSITGNRDGTFVARMSSSDTAGATVSEVKAGRTSVTNAITSAAVNYNGYLHVAAVFDAAGKTLTLYVNGAKAGSVAVAGTPWSAAGNFRLAAGRAADGSDDHLGGDLDAVKVYGRALSAAEVQRQFGVR